jgi:hypothetical protein
VNAMAKRASTKITKKPPRRSTRRRAKVAKRKAYFTYLLSTLLVIGFLIGFLIGFGYYLGQKSVIQQTHAKTETLSQIFQKVKPSQSYDVHYDEAGFGLEGMIEKLHKHKVKKEPKKMLIIVKED